MLRVCSRGTLIVAALAAALTLAPVSFGRGLHDGQQDGAHAFQDGHGGSQGSQGQSGGRSAPEQSGRGSVVQGGAAGFQSTRQGVVQSVSPGGIVLRQLDGTVVSVQVDRHTQITLDGRQGSLADVHPGYVVLASWSGSATASLLRFVRSG